MGNLSIEKILCSIAIISCTIIIGYNALYTPKVELVTFKVLSSETEIEEYDPTLKNTESQSSTYIATNNKININTATKEELANNLDGIGDVIAQSIVEYREQNGNFKNIEEIKNVPGIGDKKFDNIKDYIEI